MVALVLSLCLAPMATAQAGIKSEKILKPEKGSYVVLDKVEFIQTDNGSTVNIKDSFKTNQTIEAYNIKVDGKKGTYKTAKIETTTVEETAGTSGVSAATVTRYNWVKLVTDDPVGYDLCSTKLRVDWYDYGSSLAFKSHSISPWAAYPSQAGTHWHISSYWIGDPYIYYAWSRMDQSGNGKYYNWDFGDDAQRTDVAHYITITCYAGGYAERTISWTRSGEYWWLLDLDVYSGYGSY